MSFGTSEQSSSGSSTSAPPEFALQAQEAAIGVLNGMTQQFLDNPQYKQAGLTAPQLKGMALGDQYAENLFTNWGTGGGPQMLGANTGQAQFVNGNPASQAGFTSAGPAQGYIPHQANFTSAGNAQGYTAQQAGFNSAGNAAQVNPYQLGSIQAGGSGGAGAEASLVTSPAAQAALMAAQEQQTGANDYQPFLNPYTQQVVNTTQQQMGRANAEQDAARNAGYAKAGAFGGSRQAVAQGVSDARYAQDVGNMTAQLMSQGYDRATAMAQANTMLRQQTELQNSQLGTANNQWNAGARNARDALNAQLGTQANIASAGNFTNAGIASGNNATQASIAQAQLLGNILSGNRDASNNMAQFNAGQGNNVNLQNALMANSAGQFNAGAQNAFGLQDSQILNNMALQNALYGNQAGQFNASAINNQNQWNAGAQNANSQFNAGANNSLNQLYMQLANQMANQNASNSLQGASLQNQFYNDQMGRERAAIEMLLGTGGFQQQQLQNEMNVPWDTLSYMMNLINGTAQAGRTTQSTQQSSGSGFNFGLPIPGLK